MQLSLHRRNSHDQIFHSLDSYESLGANVEKTHRNEQGFKIFAAIMANCLRIAQTSRYQKGDHFTVDLDTKRDASERPQEGISMRMVNDSGKLWIDALSCKQLRHGNATDMQESIF